MGQTATRASALPSTSSESLGHRADVLRRLPHYPRRPQRVLQRLWRRVRDQAQPVRLGPRLLDLLGRDKLRSGLGHRRRPRERLRHGLDVVGRLPIVPGAFDPTFNGDRDAFVSKLADSTKPACAIAGTGTDSAGKKFLDVRTGDTDSGLAKIEVTKSINADTPSRRSPWARPIR